MPKGPVVVRKCKNCERDFETTNAIKLFCQAKCNYDWQNRGRLSSGSKYQDRPCKACGKMFKPMQVAGVGRQWCSIPCHKVVRKVWQDEYREGAYAVNEGERKWRFKTLYGITIAGYNEMFAAQGGVCAICGNAETAEAVKRDSRRRFLCVDHCHTKGHVRKLLCVKCNVGLGNFRENPALLRKAADYLEAH